jgi:hypothetical protein
LVDIEHANDQLVADSFAFDVAASIAAAAERGDAQAQLHMLRSSYESGVAAIAAATKWGDAQAQLHLLRSSYESGGESGDLDEFTKQRSRTFEQNNSDAILWTGLLAALGYLAYEKDDPPELKGAAQIILRNPAVRGSATAQYTLGMLIYCSQCESGTKADVLDAARWIRKAAMQGFMDAQYELGEMFRHGVFCDHIYTRFGRKYTRRASVQGHVEAIARMKELRRCVICGADDAKLACSLCHRARYCNSQCSEKHWCEGGGAAGTRHKDTCPRTHAR